MMKLDKQPKELQKKLVSGKALRIVDVRSPLEFATGHVLGALNIPLGDLDKPIPGVNTSDPVVIVCQSGKRLREFAR